MAYQPVSKPKTGVGYVPVSKKAPGLGSFFPVKEQIRQATPVYQSVKPKSITERNKELQQLTGQKTPFAATKTGIAVNTVLGLPKAALNVAREIPRGIAGTAAQATAAATGRRQEDISLQPTGIMKAFLGDKPIQPAKEGADLLKVFGVSDESAKKYGPILYAGLTLSDFVSGPGKKKGLTEAIKMAGDVNQARKVLKNAGVADDIVRSFKLDEKAVLAKTDEEVEALFKNIPKEVVAKTNPLPKIPTRAVATKIDNVFTPIAGRSVVDDVLPRTTLLTPTVSKLEVTPEVQKTLDSIQQWISGGARGKITTPVLNKIDNLNIKPVEPVSLYRIGDVDDKKFQSWSKIKPPEGIKYTERVFTPDEILVDTTDPRLVDAYTGIQKETIQQFNKIEGEVLVKPKSMVTSKVATPDLPPLPKLSPEIVKGLQSQQADATINKAVFERYSAAARRPLKEDTALAKAAKKPSNVEGLKKLTGELLTPISSRLMRINPILKKALREFEFRVAANTTKNQEEIFPLLNATKKMSKEDQVIFDLARKNADTEVIDALATKYDIHDELNRTRDVLDDIHQRAKDVGMDVGYLKDYFPRMVTNPEKFMAYLRGTEDWGLIQRALDNAATAKGLKVTDLTNEEQVGIINNLIRGYGDKVTLAKPGFTESRTIKVIDEKLNEFYESSDSALSTYIIRMNDEIEGRKLFGKASKEAIGDARIEDSIGSYVLDLAAKGEIKPDQIDEVIDIFKARFHRGKMNGALDAYRNAEYLSTMGSPISAITQIGDIAFSVYENGLYHTGKGVGKALFSKNKLTKEALGIENITQEFTKNTMSGKALDKVFKIVGMEKMDRLGKETLVNGYLSKLKNQAIKGDDVLKRELDFMFDSEEAALAMKELSEGKLTERTKLLAFNKLLDFQPVAKSEMPQKYLEMPNGRIFYMLKSFTLKQYDVFRREAIDGIISGDKKKAAQGIRNLVLLSGAFVMANATADEIKDLILDRETPISDKLVDNLWRLLGATKYDVYKARQDGVGQTVIKKILFPTSLADRFYKDVTNQLEGKEYEKGPLKGEAYNLESTQSIPVGGKLYYWWFGRGAQKEEYKQGTVTTETGAALPALPKLPTLPTLPKLPKI